MNTSTTSLVSTASSSSSSSSGFKTYTCVQPSKHTHAPTYSSRLHCSFRAPPSFRNLRPFSARQNARPTLQERERRLHKREVELARKEEHVVMREEAVVQRERRLRSGFLELAQGKVRAACDEAARKQGEKGSAGAGGRSWRQMWRRGGGEGKGWAKWEEGRFH